jgi:hypothetical protein
MKAFLAFALLSLTLPQTPNSLPDRSALKIVDLDVKEKLITHRNWPPGIPSKPPELKPTLGRGTDRNEPEIQKIQRDTSQRMAELRQLGNPPSLVNGRYATPYVEPGYEFRAEMKNVGSKSITGFLWVYRPSPNSPDLPDKEFLCNLSIKPGAAKVVKVLSPIPRTRVVDVANAGIPPGPQQPSLQDMVVNQVRFSDGSIWQRADWNSIILSRQGARKVSKGKCIAL